MSGVTTRQLEALAAIAELAAARAPTVDELADELLVSPQAAWKLCERLRAAGAVDPSSGPRSLTITAVGWGLLGQTAAPAPQLPDAQHRSWRNRYLFPHPRDAIRAWDAHRSGFRVDRARTGRGGGRTPGLEDVARVGRVLATLAGPQLDAVVAWARGVRSTRDNRVEALVRRVSGHLRRLGIVARAAAHAPAHRSAWRSADGRERVTVAVLPAIVDSSCEVDGSGPS